MIQHYLNRNNPICLPKRFEKYLLIGNHLSEYSTEEDRMEVLYNLGILDIIKELIREYIGKDFDDKYLQIGNYLSEYSTEGDKLRVLQNLGISDVIRQIIKEYIVQEFGNSRELAISQKVLTDKITYLEGQLASIIGQTFAITSFTISPNEAKVGEEKTVLGRVECNKVADTIIVTCNIKGESTSRTVATEEHVNFLQFSDTISETAEQILEYKAIAILNSEQRNSTKEFKFVNPVAPNIEFNINPKIIFTKDNQNPFGNTYTITGTVTCTREVSTIRVYNGMELIASAQNTAELRDFTYSISAPVAPVKYDFRAELTDRFGTYTKEAEVNAISPAFNFDIAEASIEKDAESIVHLNASINTVPATTCTIKLYQYIESIKTWREIESADNVSELIINHSVTPSDDVEQINFKAEFIYDAKTFIEFAQVDVVEQEDVVVTVTSSPTSILMGEPNNIDITVSTNNKLATFFAITKEIPGEQPITIEYDCSDNPTYIHTFTDTINLSQYPNGGVISYGATIRYKNSTYSTTKDITVNKKPTNIKWKFNDGSTVQDGAYTYTYGSSTQLPHLTRETGNYTINYGSSNEDIATVDENGIIHLQSAAGSCVIGAGTDFTIAEEQIYEESSDQFTLTVVNNLISISWNNASISPNTLNIGETATLNKGTIIAHYGSGDKEVNINQVTFAVNGNIGNLVGNTFTAKNAGTGTITASYGGKTAINSLTITVTTVQDVLIHSCIPVTSEDTVMDILDDITPMSSLITQQAITNNIKDNITGYKLDDGSTESKDDEILLHDADSKYFIQVFLLTNKNHKVISYVPLFDAKAPIEDQRFGSDVENTLYKLDSYTYNEIDYQIIALLRKDDTNLTILIQNK